MAHSYNHAVSSARKWGGKPEDFLPIHNWMDGSKLILADFRHRALRHHCEGIFLAETLFGTTLTFSTGRVVPVRLIAEQHVLEDLGRTHRSRTGCAVSALSPGWDGQEPLRPMIAVRHRANLS
jgi:hypothetical protein